MYAFDSRSVVLCVISNMGLAKAAEVAKQNSVAVAKFLSRIIICPVSEWNLILYNLRSIPQIILEGKVSTRPPYRIAGKQG